MAQGASKTTRISVRDKALALVAVVLSVFQAGRVRQPKHGVVVGGKAEELVAALREEVGGAWLALGDGETRPWVLLRDSWRKLLLADVVVVQATEEEGRSALWTCSGLAEVFRQPTGAFVVSVVQAHSENVRSWLDRGSWGLVDAVVSVQSDGTREALRGVREALRGI